MASKHSRIADPARRAEAADNFKLIQGIGRAIERRLHEAGIRTYAQLAGASPTDLAQLLAGSGVSAERISRQDWIGKARELAAAKGAQSDQPELVYRQHYASFTVRLSLNEDNEVRYTEVQHVQSEGKQHWAGWDEAALVRFFAEHGDLKLPAQQATESPAPPPVSMTGLSAPSAPLPVEKTPTPLQLNIANVTLDEVEAHSPNGKPIFPKRLRAMIAFELSGDPASETASAESSYTAQALAREQTSQHTVVLGTLDEQLRAGVTSYSPVVEFDLPPVGRYQLLGMILLPHEQLAGAKPGPMFRVVP